jgi:hypothetical protein
MSKSSVKGMPKLWPRVEATRRAVGSVQGESGSRRRGGEWRCVGGFVAKVGDDLWKESRGSGKRGGGGVIVCREGI